MSWELVETDAALQAVVAAQGSHDAVAIDTEFMRRDTFYPRVALVQLCFDETAYLIDPLTITDTAPLTGLLTDPGIVKVMHSASEDLEVFQHWLGALPTPLFDTQRAAGLLDIGFGMGYGALVNACLDIALGKGETRSDWLRRPLSASQCEYAAQDVIHLAALWRQLGPRCREAGKYDWVLEDSQQAAANLSSDGAEQYRRVKNGWRLTSPELAVLIAISAWRESSARVRDKPRNWIIDDAACIALATAQPASIDALSRLDLPPAVVRRDGRELVELITAAAALPEDALPARLPAPLDARQRRTLKRLKERARSIAVELEMAPEIVLPGKDFELLLREAAGEAVQAPPHWSGWRAAKVLAPLRAELSGGQ